METSWFTGNDGSLSEKIERVGSRLGRPGYPTLHHRPANRNRVDRRFYGNEGVFLWSHGSLSLVAKTGTVIPGVGTIASFDQYGRGLPNGYVHINDPGHVAFAAVLTD